MTKQEFENFMSERPTLTKGRLCVEARKNKSLLANTLGELKDTDHISRTTMKWLAPLITKYGGEVK